MQFQACSWRKLSGIRGVLLVAALLFLSTVFFTTGADAGHGYFNKPYLTYQGDPSTTITINYHTEEDTGEPVVTYDLAEFQGTLRNVAKGELRQIPGLADGRHVNTVQLTGLLPGQTYQFRIGAANDPEKVYRFRTIPDTAEPLRFAVGGDTLATGIFVRLLGHVAARSPQFLVIGGDLAYADGDVNMYGRWDWWFERWHDHDTTPEGLLIPLVMAIGNHEMNDKQGTPEERAPFYFGFFPQGGKTYFSRRFGAHLGLIVLDSAYLVAHDVQAGWLEEQLKTFAPLTFRAAVYHAPLYPSHRGFEEADAMAGRTHWLPLFDRYALTVAFEHHDHDFKRSKRLRGNEVNPGGTLYLGDGNAGVLPRKPKADLWYLEKWGRESHFWIVEATAGKMHFEAVDFRGKVFDETTVEAGNVVP